ncbi:hypothetical protein U1Q18_015494 [Sarracenia purpurea var. burkii]
MHMDVIHQLLRIDRFKLLCSDRSIEDKPYSHGKSLHEEVNLDLAAHEAEHSGNSNVYQGCQEGSLQQDTSPWETPDYQHCDLAKTYQTDDIFMYERNFYGLWRISSYTHIILHVLL